MYFEDQLPESLCESKDLNSISVAHISDVHVYFHASFLESLELKRPKVELPDMKFPM